VMSSDSDLAERQTPGLKGRYTIRDALDRLLAGTDLGYSSVGANTIRVAAKATKTDRDAQQSNAQRPSADSLEEVVVTGTHALVIIGKTLTPIRELPESIFVVTRQQMDQQMPEEINEVLRYTPGVYPEAFGTNSSNQVQNNLQLRGFPA